MKILPIGKVLARVQKHSLGRNCHRKQRLLCWPYKSFILYSTVDCESGPDQTFNPVYSTEETRLHLRLNISNPHGQAAPHLAFGGRLSSRACVGPSMP